MSNNQYLREALHDELATIRAINGCIRVSVDAKDKAELTAARIDSLRVVRRLLLQLFPRKVSR